MLKSCSFELLLPDRALALDEMELLTELTVPNISGQIGCAVVSLDE
jgi:hypothetical protein